jgi:hypothetical protein
MSVLVAILIIYSDKFTIETGFFWPPLPLEGVCAHPLEIAIKPIFYTIY